MLTAAIDILQAELKKAKHGEDTMPHILAAMNRYATLACEEQRRECSRCLECDVPKGPTHNLVLYAPLPTLK